MRIPPPTGQEANLFAKASLALKHNYVFARGTVRSMSDGKNTDGKEEEEEEGEEEEEKRKAQRKGSERRRRGTPVATSATAETLLHENSLARRRRDGRSTQIDANNESESDTEGEETVLSFSGLNAKEVDEILRLSSLKTSTGHRGGRDNYDNDEDDTESEDDALGIAATNAAFKELKVLGQATDGKLTQLHDLLDEEEEEEDED